MYLTRNFVIHKIALMAWLRHRIKTIKIELKDNQVENFHEDEIYQGLKISIVFFALNVKPFRSAVSNSKRV